MSSGGKKLWAQAMYSSPEDVGKIAACAELYVRRAQSMLSPVSWHWSWSIIR